MSPDLLLFLTEAVVKETEILYDDSVYAIIDSKTLTYVGIDSANMVIYLNRLDQYRVVHLHETDKLIEQLQYFKLAVELIKNFLPMYELEWVKEYLDAIQHEGK